MKNNMTTKILMTIKKLFIALYIAYILYFPIEFFTSFFTGADILREKWLLILLAIFEILYILAIAKAIANIKKKGKTGWVVFYVVSMLILIILFYGKNIIRILAQGIMLLLIEIEYRKMFGESLVKFR